MQLTSPSSVSKSVVDAIPFDAIPFDRVTDLPLPHASDVWSDASEFVADSAVVIGKHGGRLVGSTARSAWRNRSTVATILLVALAVVGLVALVKRTRTDDDTV